MLYVFDRMKGQPLFPITERPVPRTMVPGERLSRLSRFPQFLRWCRNASSIPRTPGVLRSGTVANAAT